MNTRTLLVRSILCLAAVVALPLSVIAEEKVAITQGLELLEKAEEWEFISLDPLYFGKRKEEALAHLGIQMALRLPRFHWWTVLGSTTVKNAETRKQLLMAMKKGINELVEKEKAQRATGEFVLSLSGCFQPRHGIKAIHKGQPIEVLVCFECGVIHFYVGDKEKEVVYTTKSPQDTFDAVLKEAKVPVPRRLSELLEEKK